MAIKVEFLTFDDLSPEDQESASDNGCGKEDADYILVTHNGERFCLESDAMEPEDVTFFRDLKWIKPLIEKIASIKESDNG